MPRRWEAANSLDPLLPSTNVRSEISRPGDLLAQLRAGTRAAHDNVEATLGLLDPTLSMVHYGVILAQFRSVYAPLEAQLAAFDWTDHGFDLESRRKLPAIDADLCALGWSKPGLIPSVSFAPDLERNRARAVGCLYVLEGATLGGQIISRHLRATLGVTPGTGGTFFHGYCERTGLMWTSFRDALARLAGRGLNADLAVATARQTFEALQQATNGSAR